jgi:hypothetical protein
VISIVSADSVTVFVAGRPFTVPSDNPRYEELKTAIANGDYDQVDGIVNASDRLTKALGNYGDVTVFAGRVTFQGRRVDNYLVDRILQMVNRGRDPEPYALFLDRVMRNPTRDAIDMLFQWVERAELPILPDGRFLAYRYVNMQYLDAHTRSMDNSPGRIVRMPRDECDLNYNNTCSRGLHFCNHKYLKSMSDYRCLIMAEDPSDVVSFPQDGGGSKGRTEKHEVLFEISMQEAREGVFFEGEDQLVFSYDRVALYQREGIKFALPEGEDCGPALAAWDAGWRVLWADRDGDQWDLVNPAGTVVDTYASRVEALVAMRDLSGDLGPVVGDDAPVSFTDRVERLRATLNIDDSDWDDKTLSDRLDEIEAELGLTDSAPPQIDRLQRAETAAGL